jgi:hypothetical protein
MHNEANSSPTVLNCLFYKNRDSANYGGHEMTNFSSSPTLINCTIYTNHSWAIHNNNSSPTLTNCIIWGGYNFFWNGDGSSPVVTYCNIESGYPGGGDGNINSDPMFVDAANGDLHLKAFSPCIDAGDNSIASLPLTDVDGDDRKIDDSGVVDTGNGSAPLVDMGMDEYSQNSKKGDIDCNGQIEISDAILALKMCSAIHPASTINTGPDVNEDTKIGIEEVIYILHTVSTLRE